MRNYLKEIETALNSGLYTLALISALSLPDICACLESPNPDDRTSVGKKYRNWYAKYAEKNCLLSPETCYEYRCSMIHNKKSKINSKYEKVAFFLPSPNQPIFNHCVLDITLIDEATGEKTNDKALVIDINNFVTGMIKSVENWLSVIKTNKNYINNSKNLMQLRLESSLNFVSGNIVIY